MLDAIMGRGLVVLLVECELVWHEVISYTIFQDDHKLLKTQFTELETFIY